MHLPIRRWVILWLALTGLTFNLEAANRVFVKAEASEEFLIDRARDANRKEQTYHFMKGRYHPGNRLDPGMEDLSFEELVYDLAVQLRKNGFFPEPELGKADLIIVVHYGSTGWPDDFRTWDGIDYFNDPRFQYFDELGNYKRPRGLTDLSARDLVHVRDNSYRAKILGMDFGQTWASDKRLLSHLSSQPRYFVMLDAYDFQRLQAGEIQWLWRTRYSIRAIGQSFATGIADMNRIASAFMGRNLKSFTQKRVDDSAFVSYGELEVIDVEEIKEEDREKDFLIYESKEFPAEIRRPRFDR